MITDIDCAYAAGIIDGEGSVMIMRCTRKYRGYVSYHLKVVVTNTEQAMILWLHRHFGGSIYALPRIEGRRKAWRWQVCTKKARVFLKYILPFMVTKQKKAELAIDFQDSLPLPGIKDARRKSADIALWYRGKINKQAIAA